MKERKVRDTKAEQERKDEPEVSSLTQWIILVLFVFIFLIPLWISNYLGMKGLEAFLKVEAPGWIIEALIGGIIYYIETKRGNWK